MEALAEQPPGMRRRAIIVGGERSPGLLRHADMAEIRALRGIAGKRPPLQRHLVGARLDHVLAAALVPLFAVASWELLVRRSLLAAATAWAARIGQRRLAAALQALGAALALLAESRPALAWSLSLHLASWLGHAGEVWLTLWLMGASTGVAEAVLLESLSLAARSAAFLIPSGWGAQEAALVALAAVTGLPAETALALGLVKRAREFAIGLPGLLAWAIAEGWRPTRTRA